MLSSGDKVKAILNQFVVNDKQAIKAYVADVDTDEVKLIVSTGGAVRPITDCSTVEFGLGVDSECSVSILDVTQEQMQQVIENKLPLPQWWEFDKFELVWQKNCKNDSAMSTHVINIDEQTLERFGSHSLVGRLYDLGAKVGDEIVLQFDTPELFLYCVVPSYVPWLLCDDVLRLVNMGFKVRVTNNE
jgi:hypothetical protein